MNKPPISDAEAMNSLAKLLWERYIRVRVQEELIHSLEGFKAKVTANNGDGTLTVSRPFDSAELTLKCSASLKTTAQIGDQVLIVALGNLSNAFILCKTDLSNL